LPHFDRIQRSFRRHDLANVQASIGGEAREANEQLGSLAYARGSQIAFKENPDLRLAAHEATHVVQQARGVQLKDGLGRPGDPYELQADRVADRVAEGKSAEALLDDGALGTTEAGRFAPLTDERRRLQQSGVDGIRVGRPLTRGSWTGQQIQGRLVPGGTLTPSATPAATAGSATPGAPALADADAVAAEIASAVFFGNVGGVVSRLRNRSPVDLVAIREGVHARTVIWLEQWFIERMHQSSRERSLLTLIGSAAGLASPVTGGLAVPIASQLGWNDPAQGGTAEEGLRRIWPALPLINRMLVYDEGFREIEQAQLDVIRTASREQRNAALKDDRLPGIFEKMDAKEEYQARLLFDDSPAGLRKIADRMIEREAKDPLFDAILALPPADRAEFVRVNDARLYDMLYVWQLELVRSMARQITVHHETFGGNEVDALIARLRLATEGRRDDMEAVQAVIDRAAALLKERQDLYRRRREPVADETELDRIDRRLDELKGLDRLFEFRRDEEGNLPEHSFMRLLSEARDDPGAFLADAQRFAPFQFNEYGARNYAFPVAKQRILMAGADQEAISAILYSTEALAIGVAPGATRVQASLAQWEANVQLRKELLADPAVARVLSRLKGSEQMLVADATTGDEFSAVLFQLNEANRNADWGQLFTVALRIARNDQWRARYNARRGEYWGAHANIHGEQCEIVEAMLRDPQHLPIALLLDFTSDKKVLVPIFSAMPEGQRERLRLGWAVSRGLVTGAITPEGLLALFEFRQLVGDAPSNAEKREAVLGAALGTEPTAAELSTGAARYQAAALMWERLQARQNLERGFSASFTETDETMDAAAREFAALWLPLRDRTPREVTTVELAALTGLHDRFTKRAEEFSEASNAISELAGTIAATVAGVLVIVATGGTATPAVIALAAASGAGARMITSEMFGADYYDPNARDAILGGVDGALAVVSARFAARAAELIGLGGKVLTSSAGRMAGEIAEEAALKLPFGHRVVVSSVESAIDGLVSGAASQAFSTLLDDETWRRGVRAGLLRVAQAALLGGLTGLGTGGILGAAAPVIGAGAGRIWRGLVGESFQQTLERAGAADVLAAARQAARNGDVAKANELAEQLERHLSPDQVYAMRGEINVTLRQRLGSPPGTAEASPREAELLRESAPPDARLTQRHLDAEWDIVRRSKPQPSSELGYVDEVDLGNGHSWKRRADGTWCRFSKVPPTTCAVIPGAPAISESERAFAEAAQEAELEDVLADELGMSTRRGRPPSRGEPSGRAIGLLGEGREMVAGGVRQEPPIYSGYISKETRQDLREAFVKEYRRNRGKPYLRNRGAVRDFFRRLGAPPQGLREVELAAPYGPGLTRRYDRVFMDGETVVLVEAIFLAGVPLL
jgi:Domain of unknown function (DUF4157)